jgi:hypothetical protein
MDWITTDWAEILRRFISFLNKKRFINNRMFGNLNILLENPAYHMDCFMHLSPWT